MDRSPFVLTALLTCLASAGCGGIEMTPGDQVRNAREIPPGPGLLSGRDGEFVIFRVDPGEEPREQAPREPQPEDTAPR
ncbi:hypothetical protein [Algihabitans albus]|uniref:hypothetical protein n=1 Tax=Algihabitans albus TaxID=2164067 RepID=UPI000E5CC539|nr:hypothetical protein [Algihabitans albus]